MRTIYLRTARERKRLTQEQLETLSGVSQAIISRLESKEDAAAMTETTFALAAALDIDPRELRFGPDPKRHERASA